MALGLGVLRLSPDAFWSMTPRELQAVLDGLYGKTADVTPPNREELAELSRQFPDEPGN